MTGQDWMSVFNSIVSYLVKVARTVSQARDGCNVFITSSGPTNSDDREDVSRGTGAGRDVMDKLVTVSVRLRSSCT